MRLVQVYRSRMNATQFFDRGLIELDQFLLHFEEAALQRAAASFRLAARLAPDNARYWSALGFALDAAERPDEALAAFRRAEALDPDDEEVVVFILTLLSEAGREDEAMAGVAAHAQRTDVDLEALKREIDAAEMPSDSQTLIQNAFIRARNFMRSSLQTAIERAERRRDPKAWARQMDEERRACQEAQEALKREIDPARVPDGLALLTPWAARLGVGDDVCRGFLWEQLAAEERATLGALIPAHAEAVRHWLDGIDSDSMPPEAAAFMYLLLGWEELAVDD